MIGGSKGKSSEVSEAQITGMNKRLHRVKQDREGRERVTEESEGGQQAWGGDMSGLRGYWLRPGEERA